VGNTDLLEAPTNNASFAIVVLVVAASPGWEPPTGAGVAGCVADDGVPELLHPANMATQANAANDRVRRGVIARIYSPRLARQVKMI
jgi:hypothetical protein